jgi:sensor c-di-GMP phosphodiesterase-like protein
MSQDAAEEIFEDVKYIQDKAANHNSWEPFCTSIDYNWTNDQPLNDDTNNKSKQTKRSSEHDLHKQPRMSYVQATKNPVSSSIIIPAQPLPPQQQGTAYHTSQNYEFDTLTQFQKQLSQLEAKQQEQLSKLEAKQQEPAQNQKSFEAKQELSNTCFKKFKLPTTTLIIK